MRARTESEAEAGTDARSGARAEARPEITPLDEGQRDRVRRLMRRRGSTCPSCGNRRRLRVGDGLYLGFLFLDEDDDAYIVAVTCGRRRCPNPRTGIVLRAGEFLKR